MREIGLDVRAAGVVRPQDEMPFEVDAAEPGHVDAPVDPAVGGRTVQIVGGVVGRIRPQQTGRELVAIPIGIDQERRRVKVEPGAGDGRQPEPRRIGVIAARILDGGTNIEGADLDAERIEGLEVLQRPPQGRYRRNGHGLGVGARRRLARSRVVAQLAQKRGDCRLQQLG